MDALSSHLTAPGRSRSSQSPSPSHSASASATSSIHKRKMTSDDHAPPFPSSFSDTRDGALTSNDDLESISARGGGADSDSEDDSEEVGDDDEEDYDASSMRNFTASRLENSVGMVSSGRNTKLKGDNSVKIESSEVVKEGGTSCSGNITPPTATGSVSAATVKDESMKNIFTDNLQTSGAYTAREESLKREEESGRLKFVCVSSDGVDEHMIWLIGLKNIFARQLPNMPKEYIVRLVMDRNHKSVMVIRRNLVVGGITYRPYASQKFGEIAFCAITADEQVKGYGTRLMNHLKQHARDVDGLTHFLTYADNNAVGYFVKQGFTKEIYLEKERWQGYIKDYDGGILMECKIDPKLPYTDLSTMIRRQRQAIDEKIRELSNCHIIYPGIDFQKKEAGIPKKAIKVEDIPGLREAGWTPDQYGHSRFKTVNSLSDQKSLTAFMRSLLKIMHDHPDSWPFKEPVDARDVPDYYDIIKDPIDLKTMSKRVESELYYVTFDMFVADVRRMFANARTYNSPETIYYKCATSAVLRQRLVVSFYTSCVPGAGGTQGFTKEIYLEKERWQGYIKDYDGGILMECKIDPKLPYTDLSTMIRRQRQAIDEKIRELSNCHIIYPGIDFQKKEAGIPKKAIKVEDIPGLREAGWTPDQYGHSRFKTVNSLSDQKSLTAFMRSLLKIMHDHPDSWPFKEPVDARDVPDYYDIIKDPIDLKTMSKRVESELYYVTFDMFVADVRRMFANARTYNSPETIYYKCATRLESHFSNKVQAGLQSSIKIQ